MNLFNVSVTAFLLASLSEANGASVDLFLTASNNKDGKNTTSQSCLLRPDYASCPDPDLHFILYSGNDGEAQEVDLGDPDWLALSGFNPELPTVLLVHGHRGGDGFGPMVILRDEYTRRGEHNIISIDWGAFTMHACYVEAVQSLKHVGRCLGQLLVYLQLVPEQVTCVGFDLGAHLCGVAAKNTPASLARVVALDPARPLVELLPVSERLDPQDAQMVQIIHSDVTFYGLATQQGSIEFCINNGSQPFCNAATNPMLCSHWQSVCFMAESLDPSRARTGAPCIRGCPQGASDELSPILDGESQLLGELTSATARGTFCVNAEYPPFCPVSYASGSTDSGGSYGDPRCCPPGYLGSKVALDVAS